MFALSITLDKKLSEKIARLRTGLPEVLDKASADTASYGKGLIIRSTAKDTGRTQGGWVVNRLKPSAYMIWNRFKHALYLETGTGLYGPLHRRIYPKVAKFLMWRNFSKNTLTGWTKVASTAGMPAQPTIKPNAEKIQKDLNTRVRNYIRRLWKSALPGGR